MPPFTADAVKVCVEPGQSGFDPAVIAIVTLGVTDVVMTIVIAFEVAVVGLAHKELEVITQVIIDPVANVELEYVAPVPTFVPFTFHW